MSDDGIDQTYVDRLIDERDLEAYLQERLGPSDHFEVERHEAGNSNDLRQMERDRICSPTPPCR